MGNERLRSAMGRAGASVEDIAQLCAVDPKTVQRWIGGREPYARSRMKIAARLRVEVDYLWPDAASVGSPAEVRGVYAHRADVPLDLWRSLLTGARAKIDLVGYALLFFPEQHPNLADLLRRKGEQGCAMRVAVADPDAEHTQERDRLEGLNGTLPDRVRTTVRHFGDLFGARGFELRLHEVHLYAGMYRFDDQAIVTPYLVGANGYQHPALHLQRLGPHGIFEQYASQIELVWSQARDSMSAVGSSV